MRNGTRAGGALRSVTRKVAVGVCCLATTAGVGLVSADAVDASPGMRPADAAAPVRVAASHPCADIDTWTSGLRRYAQVTNDCSYDVNMRMIWGNAVDGSCQTYSPGEPQTESRGRQANMVEARAC
jgi:hypothetical protein